MAIHFDHYQKFRLRNIETLSTFCLFADVQMEVSLQPIYTHFRLRYHFYTYDFQPTFESLFSLSFIVNSIVNLFTLSIVCSVFTRFNILFFLMAPQWWLKAFLCSIRLIFGMFLYFDNVLRIAKGHITNSRTKAS